MNGYFNENFTYDKQGNILSLKRKKDNVLIDDLAMHYRFNEQSNQLDYIVDAGGSQSQYNVKEYQNKSTATTNEFNYDANGNMTSDLDRDIATIQYNLLNLPDIIQFKNGNQIVNKYDAGGQKLSTRYFTKNAAANMPILNVGELYSGTLDGNYTGTDYLGNIEYDFYRLYFDPQDPDITPEGYYDALCISRVHNPEGYATFIASNTITRYQYYRRDHLGNNREVWNANSNLTLQRNQYYPSGLPWASNSNDNIQSQPYKYNGKEFVEMHGLDEYDSEARWYIPSSVRTPTPDPLAEKYYSISPYAWCGNNPVRMVDPDGRSPIYAPDGTFLGTDDDGLQGGQLILDRADFTQGMTHSNAQKVLWAGTMSEDAHTRMDEHVAGLSSRPDYDGFVDVSEGIAWAKAHPGALDNNTPNNTLYIDASKLDFGDLSTSNFKKEGMKTPQNLFDLPIAKSAFFYSLRATVYALGRVDMILENRQMKTVSIVNNSATDYDWNLGGGAKRDAYIRAERWRVGLNDTHGFKTYYYGIGRLNK